MAITLTESARDRIRGYLDADHAAIGLRFGVARTGCSGWGYKVDMAKAEGADDTVFEEGGVRVYVDAASRRPVTLPDDWRNALARLAPREPA